MNTNELNKLILNATYQTKYEAILDVTSKEIMAYEALAKFDIDQNIISTEKIFQYLHHNNALFMNWSNETKHINLITPLKGMISLLILMQILLSVRIKKLLENIFTSPSKKHRCRNYRKW